MKQIKCNLVDFWLSFQAAFLGYVPPLLQWPAVWVPEFSHCFLTVGLLGSKIAPSVNKAGRTVPTVSIKVVLDQPILTDNCLEQLASEVPAGLLWDGKSSVLISLSRLKTKWAFLAGIKRTNSFSFPGFLLFSQKFASIVLQVDECGRRDSGSAVLEVQCQRSPCSSDIPMAVVSMWSKHEDTLDPDPGWGTEMRKDWVIRTDSTWAVGAGELLWGLDTPGVSVCDIGHILHLQALLCIMSTKITLYHSQENWVCSYFC